MANLGAEVSRIISARNRNDLDILNCYLKNANKIINDIMILPEMKNRRAEIAMLSTVINDIPKSKPSLRVSSKNIISYFIPLAGRLINLN